MAMSAVTPATPSSKDLISRTRSNSRSGANAQSISASGHHQPLRRRSTIRRLSIVLHKALTGSGQETGDSQDSGGGYIRCRPESLLQLCHTTKFSKKELQLMYRGFKQGCPTGAVSLDQFKEIYAQFFPQVNGDTGQYAVHVFNTFDRNGNGRISFEEFVINLSTLSRGSMEEKLRWIFDLYDVDRDGVLTKNDMNKIIGSIYCMMGAITEPPMQADTVEKHIEYVFEKMDENRDGTITMQNFLDACQKDKDICQSIGLFDTCLL